MEVTNRQYYHCAICGRTSTIKAKIEECEASHIKVDESKLLQTEYSRSRNKYPCNIGVPMENGKIAWYSFNYDAEDKSNET